MTEQDLIDLGFERVDTPSNQSEINEAYYFYTHTDTGIDFFTSADYESKLDDWWVSMFENDSCRIFNKVEIDLIIQIINKNTI